MTCNQFKFCLLFAVTNLAEFGDFLFIYIIFVFIPVTRWKATEALYVGQAITPTCFRRCQDIAVRL